MIPGFVVSFVEGLLGPKFSKFAQPLIYGLLILLVIGGIVLAFKIHDHRVIAQHQASQDAANAKADRAADAKAADQRRADDARLTNETEEVNHAVEKAGSDPAARRAAYYNCVRLQQAARAAKRVVPACS